MPFEQLTPRPLTAEGIQTYAPVTSGVYGISNAREWIYIGETNNIQGALLDHIRDRKAELMTRQPKGFVFELCDGERRLTRQSRLVEEYEPACNRRSPSRRSQ